MKTILNFIFAVLGIGMAQQFAWGQTWTQTSLPTNRWCSIGSSADGVKLVAAQYRGLVCTSTNSGTNWVTTSLQSNYWNAVASSADGTKLIIVGANVSSANPGGVYTSTNSGATWVSNSLPAEYWTAAASSADGSKLIAMSSAVLPGSASVVYTSTNAGLSWVSRTNTGAFFNGWISVASSADGTKLVAVGYWVYYSTNSGTSWTPAVSSYRPGSVLSPDQPIACSADGSKWIAAFYGSADAGGAATPVCISTNYGTTWTALDTPASDWFFISSSADGNRLVAGGMRSGGSVPGPVYTSTNSGLTWLSNSLPAETFSTAASSADGGKWVVAGGGAFSDSHVFTSRAIVSPQLYASSTRSNVTVGWIVPSTNFVLQQNFNLGTTNWVTLANVPVLNLTNLRNEVALPVSSNAFYRLKTP